MLLNVLICLHLFTVGSVAKSMKTKEVEIYTDKHFCALTGRIFRQVTQLQAEQSGLDYVFGKYRKPEKQKTVRQPPGEQHVTLSDSEILQAAMKDKKFCMLYSGHWEGYGSQSEADSALCWKIVFYAGRDPDTVDRIFRSSALYRQKWDQKHFSDGRTYGEETISNACRADIETRHEFRKRREREQFNEFIKSVCDI